MMTIEEKAKAYDEAISRAKDSYGTGAYDDATTEFIFPELSESEDRKHTTQGVLNAFNKKNGGEIINSKNKPSRDALLESAKKLLDGCNGIWWSDGELKKAILKDFPELAESEDEKIRKAIISYLYNELNNFKQPTPRTNEFESWLAYLEKQKEQKPAEWSEEDEKRLNRISWYLTHKGYNDDADWLKSLLPSWKPSEE